MKVVVTLVASILAIYIGVGLLWFIAHKVDDWISSRYRK